VGTARTEIELALRLDPKCLSARYTQAILSGEAQDPAAFLRRSRLALAQHSSDGLRGGGLTLADIVLNFRS
jgi:hypothetical protein